MPDTTPTDPGLWWWLVEELRRRVKNENPPPPGGGVLGRPVPPDRGTVVQLPEPPKQDARGPVPVFRPPKGPASPTPTTRGPSVADSLPRELPRTAPSATPRTPGSLAAWLGRTATLWGAYAWVIGSLVIGPYFGYGNWDTQARTFPRSSGPPRRTRYPRNRTDSPPDPYARWDIETRRHYGEPRARPVPTTRVRTYPLELPPYSPNPVPGRPRAVPGTRPSVRPLPAPAPFPQPLPGPGYDPYTVAPPTPQPRRPAQPFPQPRAPAFPFPSGVPDWLRIGDPSPRARPIPRRVGDPLTPQRPPRPARPPRPVKDPDLTRFQDPVPSYFSQPAPSNADPCTRQRTAQRRKQRKKRAKCRKFVTKTIRVCATKKKRSLPKQLERFRYAKHRP